MRDRFALRIGAFMLGAMAALAGMALVPAIMHMQPDIGTGAMAPQCAIGTSGVVFCIAFWAGVLFGFDSLLPFVLGLVLTILTVWSSVAAFPPWWLWGVTWPTLSACAASVGAATARLRVRSRFGIATAVALCVAAYVGTESAVVSWEANRLARRCLPEALADLSETVMALPELGVWRVSYNVAGRSSPDVDFTLRLTEQDGGVQRLRIRCDVRSGNWRLLRLHSHERHGGVRVPGAEADAIRVMREHGLSERLCRAQWSHRDDLWALSVREDGYLISVRLDSRWLYVDVTPSG
ncbi:MAG: hypothetical protein AB7Y46_17325 [Armatimonadota bacterium]